jgi:hypothetical protein
VRRREWLRKGGVKRNQRENIRNETHKEREKVGERQELSRRC